MNEFEIKASGADYLAVGPDGRRTALKTTMKAAKDAAERKEWLCKEWPHCKHPTPDICARTAVYDWQQEDRIAREERVQEMRRGKRYAK